MMKPFEFDGEKYKQASRHQKEWGRMLIEQMNLEESDRVLDMGCGDGVLTAEIAAKLPSGSVVGMDASASMIAMAQTQCGDNLTFLCTDVNTLNYENEFDVIFSNATLHWIHDHRKLAKNCFRALKSGGRLYWNFAAAGTCTTFNRIVKEQMSQPEYCVYFQNFTWPWNMPHAAGYEANFAGLPMAELTVEEENKDRCFADENEMIRWIDQPGMVPFLAVLPTALKSKFREQIIVEMIQNCQQNDGRCFEYFRRLHLIGRKK